MLGCFNLRHFSDAPGPELPITVAIIKNVAKVMNFPGVDFTRLRKLEAQRLENVRVSRQKQLEAVIRSQSSIQNIDVGDMVVERAEILVARQKHIEQCQSDAALEQQENLLNDMSRLGKFSATKRAQRLILSWYEPFSKSLQDEVLHVRQGRPDKDASFFSPVLLLIPHYEIATIVINRAVNAIILSGNLGAPVRSLCTSIHEELSKHIVSVIEKEHRKSNLVSTASKSKRNDLVTQAGKPYRTMNQSPAAESTGSVELAVSYAESRNLLKDKYSGRHISAIASDSARTIVSRVLSNDMPWDELAGIRIAARLLDLLIIHSIGPLFGATHNTNIFIHDTILKSANPIEYVGIIRFDGDFYKELKLSHTSAPRLKIMDLQYLPMLIPPNSWMLFTLNGRTAYLTLPAELLRAHCKSQVQAVNRLYESGSYASLPWSDYVKNDGQGIMQPLLEALDMLGQVPWRINSDVFAILDEVWRLKLVIGHVPPQIDLPIPKEPVLSDDKNAHRKSMHEWRSASRRLRRKNAEFHSLRCDFMIKYRIAQSFLLDEVYFPQNLDFRGRAYPIPQNLNHMSDDVCRGLLRFSNSKPLGPRGLFWLKVHLANLFGVSKVSLYDRVSWVNDRLNLVKAVAKYPLGQYSYHNVPHSADDVVNIDSIMTGFDWWKSADDPFQALATCIEISNAISLPNPEMYKCSLPVHQDGSCNGLQHYAALGRDARGGEQVNLVDSDKPQDVYSEVCLLVKRKVEADLLNGNLPDDVRERAQFILPMIDRKVIKQTVMTSVYGVTLIGARQQIESKISEKYQAQTKDKHILTDEEEGKIYFSALYLAAITMDTIGEVFTSSRLIMDWLSACAKIVAEHGQVVSWMTPLGLPVCQPYRREREWIIRTQLQSLQLFDSSEALPVSSNRQKSAFPPNFIHSLDSTHMMMTALKMKELGITDFAAVHDSYWCLPCDVDDMNKEIRNCFCDLYTQPVLDKFRDSLCLRFPSASFPPVPPTGSLDLNLAKTSTYLFS